jgi:hypothetical protein
LFDEDSAIALDHAARCDVVRVCGDLDIFELFGSNLL